jgi:DNA-binding transcriptional regulator LsrR (DeoR family)
MSKKPLKNHREMEPPDRSAGRIARNRMRIAWMYYVEGLTQNEIADQLGIGRVTVVRNIGEAIRQREVKIWIEGEVAECVTLENELKQAFKLDDAVVVPEPSSPAGITKSIGAAAGMYTTEHLRDDFVLGVGWGATLYESLLTLSPKNFKGVEVVSLLGGVVEAKRFNPAEFAWQFSSIVGADCYLLTAPAIVDSAETRKALVERCGLQTVFDHAKKMDMALLSVGTMAPETTAFRFGFLSEEDRASLKRAGAVGDLLFNFFDVQGRLVDHPINSRVMSMPVETLQGVPKKVVASGGLEKVDSLLGIIKLVGCNVLITNEATAQELLNRVRP